MEKYGEYIVKEIIGKGGFGEVFSVEGKDGVRYALKICKSSDDDDLKRFRREVRLLASVTHQNVIGVIHHNLDNKPPFFVMPLCEGSLSERDYDKNVEQLINDLLQICQGLEALHSKGIIHRDIKPSNILIDGDVLKLSDLGLGKFENRDTITLTGSSTYMGTRSFTPPEFLSTNGVKNAEKNSDIYQLGKTIYSLYTKEDPTYINKERVPGSLYYIIQKCTNNESKDRYQNIKELRNALNEYLAILKENSNPIDIFYGIIKKGRMKKATKEDICQLFNVVYEFKEDPESFYSKVGEIPDEYFGFLNEGDLKTFVDVYKGVVSELNNNRKLEYSDAETIANQMRKVFVSTKSIEIRTLALEVTLFFAFLFNRYEAMRTFNSMLALVKTDCEAHSVASMLNENLDKYEKIVSQQDPPLGIHKVIQGIRLNIIKKTKK